MAATKISPPRPAIARIRLGTLSTKKVTAICCPLFRAMLAASRDDHTRQYLANSSVQKSGRRRTYRNMTSMKTSKAITEIMMKTAASAHRLIISLVRSIKVSMEMEKRGDNPSCPPHFSLRVPDPFDNWLPFRILFNEFGVYWFHGGEEDGLINDPHVHSPGLQITDLLLLVIPNDLPFIGGYLHSSLDEELLPFGLEGFESPKTHG